MAMARPGHGTSWGPRTGSHSVIIGCRLIGRESLSARNATGRGKVRGLVPDQPQANGRALSCSCSHSAAAGLGRSCWSLLLSLQDPSGLPVPVHGPSSLPLSSRLQQRFQPDSQPISPSPVLLSCCVVSCRNLPVSPSPGPGS